MQHCSMRKINRGYWITKAMPKCVNEFCTNVDIYRMIVHRSPC